MRSTFYSLLALIALGGLIPSASFGQATGLSITNLSLVSETRISRTVFDLEYRADIVNTGAARAAVTATVTSLAPVVQIIRGNLQFVNVPANGRATSTNTFVIRVDRSVPFNIANLVWAFSAPGAPAANAGPNQTVAVGATATLNGSGSTNPSGVGTLSFNWAFTSRPAGSAAILVNPSSVSPTFVVDRAGSYVIALTVNNGVGTDTASVTVSTGNTAPVANAGPNQSVAVGALVTLDGSLSSDVDGNQLTYLWTITGRPTGSTAALSSTTAVKPTFTADRAGSYSATLVVNDGTLSSNTATVTVSTVNTPPVSNPGPDQTANVGAVVQLNGAGSTDVDGDSLTYKWSFTAVPAGSTAVLSSLTAVNPTFTIDREGTYAVQLIVNDGKVDGQPKTVTITTSTVPAPTAIAGPGQTVKHGSLVQLAGSGTDPQGRPLTFLWSFTSRPAGSAAVLSSTTIANPTFSADRPGNYVLQLIVNNGFKNSPPSTVTITTTNSTPVANPGPNQTVTLGSIVTLNGSASSDADGDAVTYAWSFTSRPAGSTATLLAATSATPTFIADVAGSYVVQLIVSDAFSSSVPATVTITPAQPGQIIIPSATVLALGQSVPFAVSLSTPAPAAGVTVTLVIADGTKASLSTLTVAFAPNATLPASQPQLSGTGLGSTTISATAPNYTSASGTAQVNATVLFSPSTQTIIGTATQNLTLTLSAAAPAGGVTVNLSSSNTAAATVPSTVTFAPSTTTAIVPVTGVAAGSATITASAANIPAATAAVTVVNTLTITTASLPNGRVNAAYSQSLAATGGVQPYVWSLTSGTLPAGLTLSSGGVISGTPTTAAANVALTFSITDSGVSPQTKTVNLTLTIDPAVPATITATSGSGQSAFIGAPFAAPLVATVTDAGGNPVGGVTVTFAAPGSGFSGTFAGGANTAVTNGSGVATSVVFTANNTVGGPYTVTASVTGVATPAQFSLTNTQRPVATLTATSGGGQSVQISTQFPQPLVVTATDSNGQPVPNATVTFSVPATGASGTFAGGNTALTNASGVASALITANTSAGSFTVSASVAGVPPATFSLTNTAGPASSIAVTLGSPQSAATGAAFAPLVATVTDAGGNPVSGATVTFTAPASGASGTFAGGVNTAITTPAGIATSTIFTANATVGGPYTVNATVSGVATPAQFSLTNTQRQVATLTATSGGGQTIQIGTQFPLPLVVTATDSGGQPVPNATVTFVVPGSGPRAAFAGANTAVTNASGVATSSVLTANLIAGSYTISASVPGVTGVGFNLTNVPGPAAAISPTGGTPQSAQVGASFGLPLIATVTDAGSNPVAGVQVTFTAPGAGASGTFPGGGTTATANTNASGVATSPAFTANATAGGPYNVTASVSGVASPTNFALTNTPGSGGTALAISSVTVGNGLQAQITLTLSQPPSAPTTVNITSANVALVRVAGRPNDLGTAQISITVGTGITTVTGIYVQGFAASGSAQLTASASGFTSGTSTATLAPSGFVISGPGGIGVSSFSVPVGTNNTSITVTAARLNGSFGFVETQQVRGGTTVTVPVSSAPTAVGTIPAPGQVTVLGGEFSASTTFSAVATGAASITAGTPSGFSTPTGGTNTVTANVTAAGLVPSNVTVGQNLQAPTQILLNSPPAANLTVTVTSADPARVLLSTTPTGVGATSISLTVEAGRTISPEFYVYGLASTGTVSYNATAAGYSSGSANVTLAPSGFVIAGSGIASNAFTITSQAANQSLEVYAVYLDAGGFFVGSQAVRGGLTVNVPITSSNNALGTIIVSPLTYTGGVSVQFTEFDPIASGTVTITAGTPPGFSTPASGAVITATISAPSLGITTNRQVGRNLQIGGNLFLGAFPPPGGVNVTLTSNSGNLLLAASPTAAGSSSIVLSIPEGNLSAVYYIFVTASTGNATYTATAPGFASRTGTIQMVPSGVIISGPTGYGSDLNATLAGPPQPVTLQPAALDPLDNFPLEVQALVGGLSLSVNLTNSNPVVGTVTTPVSIAAGSDTGTSTFTPLIVGTTNIAVTTPALFTQASAFNALLAKVQ